MKKKKKKKMKKMKKKKATGLCSSSYRRRGLNTPHQMKVSFFIWFHICHRPNKNISDYRKKNIFFLSDFFQIKNKYT